MNGSSQKAKKVKFELSAPNATTVGLAGDFTGWEAQPLALKKSKSGVWSVSVSLAPGSYEYRYLVDGEWADDPGCSDKQANPFGGVNSVRHVG